MVNIAKKEAIYLKIDELESLRLMDLENIDQIECAEKMNIGRTTLQRIYKQARFKVADSIINGRKLIIQEEMHARLSAQALNEI
ncbi:MAG: DUF134 domain-containing protein [Alkaliphilus sp.]